MSTQKVVGVSFAAEAAAPTVVLKAAGEDAAALLEQARAQGAPTVRMPELTDRLYRTPIDAPVDKALFPVMAVLLIHIMKSDRLQRENQP